MTKRTKTRPLHRSCKQSHVARGSMAERLIVGQKMPVQFRSSNLYYAYTVLREAA